MNKLIAMLGIVLCLSSHIALAENVSAIDRIIAIVGDDVIVMSELDNELRRAINLLKKEKVEIPPQKILLRQVIERLINQKLQQAEAERLGIVIGEEQLAQTVSDIAKRNNLSISQLRETLASQGTSFQSFRNKIRHQFILNKLIEKKVARRITVSNREVESFIKREVGSLDNRTAYRLQHILIALPDGSSSDKVKVALSQSKEIIAKLKQGADFRQLAITHSNARNALSGGDLGWLKPSKIPTAYLDKASKMDKGQVSEPFRSPIGIHIMKVIDFKVATGSSIVEQVHARHILVRTNEITSDKDANTRLTQLRQRIQNGDDFANLARSHSDDKGSAIQGGDMGWLNSGDVVPDFEAEMNKLKKNQISPVFKTQFGWHIVQVLDRRQHDSTQELRKAKVRSMLKNKKIDEETELYLRRLRDEGYVKLMLNDG